MVSTTEKFPKKVHDIQRAADRQVSAADARMRNRKGDFSKIVKVPRDRRQSVQWPDHELQTRSLRNEKRYVTRRRDDELPAPAETIAVNAAPQRKSVRFSFDVSIPALLLYFGFLVGVMTVLIHITDYIWAWPYYRYFVSQNIVFILCGATLAWLSWTTYQERNKYC